MHRAALVSVSGIGAALFWASVPSSPVEAVDDGDVGKTGLRLAERRIVPCGEYTSTLRQVLEYFPQSTLRDAARGEGVVRLREPALAPFSVRSS